MDMPDWEPPADWRRIRTLETHAGGEPLRIVTDGLPEIPGETILEKRRTFRDAYDHLRTALVWEPRGHADMYGAIPTAPVSTDADLGVLFFHNDGLTIGSFVVTNYPEGRVFKETVLKTPIHNNSDSFS